MNTEALNLKTLRPDHPRLILSEELVNEFRSRVATDPVAVNYLDEMKSIGVDILTQPPVERFTSEEVVILPPQRPLEGEQKLLIHLPEKTASARLAVLFTPATAAKTPPLRTLEEWK